MVSQDNLVGVFGSALSLSLDLGSSLGRYKIVSKWILLCGGYEAHTTSRD